MRGIPSSAHGVAICARAECKRFARAVATGLVVLFAGALALAAHAQSDDPLPARVGRLANVHGAFYHSSGDGSDDDWIPIALNYPVAQGDNLWADHDARAEVDYGGGQFRMWGDTNVHVSRLDERQLALFVASGRVIVRVRYLQPDDSVRVDTLSTQITLERPGLYRIDVDANAQQTTLLVREGEAAVATSAGAQHVLPGQVASVRETANATADVRSGGGLDAFDTWSAERDRVYEQPRENAYVSREMVGQADLDAYGQWQPYPEYGAVWFPTVDPEWAPYRFGQWTWLPGFGYTWVDSAAWGYAPFHYGRWAYIAGRWGWCPGAFVARPSWAPALVAWYGDGVFGGSPVYGWVPLGWGEPFVPAWHGCGSRCYARYNRPYAVNVAERSDARPTRYANWLVPGGATAVPAGTLTSGRPVAPNRVALPAYRPVAPALTTVPPAVKPAPVRPGAVRAGNGTPLPAAALAARDARRASPPAAEPPARIPTSAPAPLPSRGAPTSVPQTRAAPLPVPPTRATPLPVPQTGAASPPVPQTGATPLPVPRTGAASPPVPQTPATPLPVPQTRTPLAPSTRTEPPARPIPSPSAPGVPERSVRPMPVPAPALAPAPIRVPAPALPLPRMPSPPVPGVAPAPPAAVVPTPPRAPVPIGTVPPPRTPAPAVVPAPAVPVAPRPPTAPN
ncbi:MAG TPA: DUF6600 domain-containing protein [Casimicrobiaceae bacterium]|nr:DUF6600 domain-containing protein [Casimicrobiaceae bacterium]